MLDQTQTPLLSQLQACAQRTYAPFHTPGHKRGQGAPVKLKELVGQQALQADLPELPELDNLFAPESVIQAAQALAAEAFGADRTWFLVNGSTGGVMAAILATCQPGDFIILPRNVHQSAIAGLVLAGAIPIFIQPAVDITFALAHGLDPAAVEIALQTYPTAKAVLLVSPTYHGVCSNVAEIAQITQKYNVPLLVDEAHGAHFQFHPDLPTAALAAGADLVVQSPHKTLASLTQAAMLHLRGNRLSPTRIQAALGLVQSTSPSYLLLASLDAARQQMATEGFCLLTHTLTLAQQARSQLQAISGLKLLTADAPSPGFFQLDLTRITVHLTSLGQDGFTADAILHQEMGVTAELPTAQTLTFIISLGNTPTDIERLVTGFQRLGAITPGNPQPLPFEFGLPTSSPFSLYPLPALTPREAFFASTEIVSTQAAVNRISADLICPYPPGIPLLFPGEPITPDAIAALKAIRAAGGTLTGCTDPTLQTLKVIH